MPPPQVPFARKLVLNQWPLSLFSVKRFAGSAAVKGTVKVLPHVCATTGEQNA
jgi:hypothetical protein